MILNAEINSTRFAQTNVEMERRSTYNYQQVLYNDFFDEYMSDKSFKLLTACVYFYIYIHVCVSCIFSGHKPVITVGK